jgi:hypothetical protein
MAYTEAEKLNIIKQAFKHKWMQLETLAQLYAWAAVVSETKIINMARNALVINRENAVSAGATSDQSIADIDELDAELAAIIE